MPVCHWTRLTLVRLGPASHVVKGCSDGRRARLTVGYEDGLEQTVHYKIIKPAAAVVADLGRFLTSEQWFEKPDDPFGRSPSVISYDYDERSQVTEDNRAWIAGLGDEGGSGSWLAAIPLRHPDDLPPVVEVVAELLARVPRAGTDRAVVEKGGHLLRDHGTGRLRSSTSPGFR